MMSSTRASGGLNSSDFAGNDALQAVFVIDDVEIDDSRRRRRLPQRGQRLAHGLADVQPRQVGTHVLYDGVVQSDFSDGRGHDFP